MYYLGRQDAIRYFCDETSPQLKIMIPKNTYEGKTQRNLFICGVPHSNLNFIEYL